MRRKLKLRLTLLLLCAGVALLGAAAPNGSRPAPGSAPTPKYIFIFLADGAGLAHLEITRRFNRSLYQEGMVITDRIMSEGYTGLLTTHPANGLTTDSAAAATALASGCKAKNGWIGMCADGSVPATVMERAKSLGMRIGLVTNSTVYDASPAAFAGHVPDRLQYSAIVDQYLRFEPNLLMGGGRDVFLPRTEPGSRRKDGADMIAAFQKRGYAYASNKQELARVHGDKVLGLFSMEDMSFELDRNKDVEPAVSDMTEASIRLLQERDDRGFMVFIETENTDTASHLTDVASVIQALREFDRAVGLGYRFYQKHPRETLLLVTSDHETGGLGFTRALKDASSARGGSAGAGGEEELKKIQSISISLKAAAEILRPNLTSEAIDQLMAKHFKGFVLAPDLKEKMLKKNPISRTIYLDSVVNALGMMVANNTQAYFSTTSHTNQPVFVAAIGVGAERFRGYQDNTDFAKNLFELLR